MLLRVKTPRAGPGEALRQPGGTTRATEPLHAHFGFVESGRLGHGAECAPRCEALPAAEVLWVRAGSVAGSLPEDSQTRQTATLFFTGLLRPVPPTPRPHRRLRLPGLGSALGPPASLAPISRSSGPLTFPAATP